MDKNSENDSIFNIEFGDIKNTIVDDSKELMSKTYQTKTRPPRAGAEFKTKAKSTVVSRKAS
jgi:hypothetical protein